MSVGIAAARRLERALGPAAGLRAYRRLYRARDHQTRADAVREAVRCADLIADDRAIAEAARTWRSLRGPHRGMLAIAVGLAQAGRLEAAITLAEAEAFRRRDGRGDYLLGRLLRLAGRREEMWAAFARATRDSDDPRVATTVAVLRLADGEGPAGIVAEDRTFPPEAPGPLVAPWALALAREVELSSCSPVQRLAVLRVRLDADNPYVRARALASLAELAAADGAVGRRAMHVAAQHADRMGAALSWVEANRIEAALAHHRDETAAGEARAALAVLRATSEHRGDALARAWLRCVAGGEDYLEAAEAVVAGVDTVWPRRTLGASAPDWLKAAFDALAVVSGLQAHRTSEVRERLGAWSEASLSRGPALAPVWTAWQMAARSRDPAIRGFGRDGLRRALTAGTSAPPRGYRALVGLLTRGRDGRARVLTWRRAALRGEPGAAEGLSGALVAAGWEAYADGNRELAAVRLREGRRRDDEGGTTPPAT
ncbi:MAG: hypothetical protein AAF928_22100 [Myxococcota bacterium]